MNKPKNEIEIEQIEKIVETAFLLNCPLTALNYDGDEIDDYFKSLLNIALINQIDNMLGYNLKSKFEGYYAKVLKLTDDEEIESLVKHKIAIDQVFSESKKTADELMEAYGSFLENPKVKEGDKEIRCQACNRLLTDKVVVYRKHGYEDYYCTIDCLKSKVFQESVKEQ